MIENPLLIFDLGNVLLRFDNDYFLEQVAKACPDPKKAVSVIKAYWAGPSADTGKGTVEDFFRAACEDLGFDGDWIAFENLWCCHFTHDPEMEELVIDLVAKYDVVLLSNTDDAHWRHIRREYPVLNALKRLYTSFELRMRKPDPAIYLHVLEAEGYPASRAIFIDDRLENVEAARALGIHGIHFSNRDALKAELAALGIQT